MGGSGLVGIGLRGEAGHRPKSPSQHLGFGFEAGRGEMYRGFGVMYSWSRKKA